MPNERDDLQPNSNLILMHILHSGAVSKQLQSNSFWTIFHLLAMHAILDSGKIYTTSFIDTEHISRKRTRVRMVRTAMLLNMLLIL